MLSSKDKEYLRSLAKKVREISQDPIWEEKKDLWKKKNSLVKTRPLVLCSLPEEVWPEIIPQSEIKIEDSFYRDFEWYFLKQIYRWSNIKDDEIITDKIYIPIVYEFNDWIENRERPYSGDGKKAMAFHPVIHEYNDLRKLRKPQLKFIDYEETEQKLEMANNIFGDILTIIKGRPFSSDTDNNVTGWGLSAIDLLCELRGMENIFYDMVLEPSFVHEAMEFITDGLIHYLSILESEGLLFLNNNEFIDHSNTPLGSNGLAITDKLPGSNYDSNNIKLTNIWGYLMAQEFSEVSPDMHKEFVLNYQKPIGDKFGLTSYGCCEPNDKKWDNIFNTFQNLRELSVSHVADLLVAAEKIKDKYVLSWKPRCTIINENNEVIEKEMKKSLEILKDCHAVICLRDNLTLFGDPEKAGNWTKIMMKASEKYI